MSLLPLLLFFLLLLEKRVKSNRLKSVMKSYPWSNFKVNWSWAQAYCREKHTDLVSFRNELEMKDFAKAYGWIGAFRENETSEWKWSRGNEPLRNHSWASEPRASRRCAYKVSDNQLWFTDPCDDYHSFSCFDEKVTLVKENKTWEEALDHCRALGGAPTSPNQKHLYDLASITSDDEQRYADSFAEGATTDEVWIGLRFLAGRWTWVDGQVTQHYGFPSCAIVDSCGVLTRSGSEAFDIADCSEKRNFLCLKSL